MKDFPIKTIDIDTYLDWLFSIEENEENKQIAFNLNPNSTKWQPFTEAGRVSVKEYRKECFNNHLSRFNNYINGSPLPIIDLAKDEFEGIQEIYSPLFATTENYVLRGCIVYDWVNLAEFCGYIDFLKYLDSLYREPDRVQNRIKFFFGKSEFVELVKSLIETKVVIGQNDKEVIEYFSKVLEVEIDANGFHDTAYKFKKRKAGSETPFLTKLKTNLINSLQK